MWVLFDSNKNLVTAINHGQTIKQGGGFDFYICFNNEKAFKTLSDNPSLEFEVDGVWTSEEVVSKQDCWGRLVRFSKLEPNEYIGKFEHGTSYICYHFVIFPGSPVTKNYGEEAFLIKVGSDISASGKINIAKTFGNADVPVITGSEYTTLMLMIQRYTSMAPIVVKYINGISESPSSVGCAAYSWFGVGFINGSLKYLGESGDNKYVNVAYIDDEDVELGGEGFIHGITSSGSDVELKICDGVITTMTQSDVSSVVTTYNDDFYDNVYEYGVSNYNYTYTNGKWVDDNNLEVDLTSIGIYVMGTPEEGNVISVTATPVILIKLNLNNVSQNDVISFNGICNLDSTNKLPDYSEGSKLATLDDGAYANMLEDLKEYIGGTVAYSTTTSSETTTYSGAFARTDWVKAVVNKLSSTLSNSISNEIANRQSEDNKLDEKIAEETANRQSEDNGLSSRITDIENDYLKNSDKDELKQLVSDTNVATRSDLINGILIPNVSEMAKKDVEGHEIISYYAKSENLSEEISDRKNSDSQIREDLINGVLVPEHSSKSDGDSYGNVISNTYATIKSLETHIQEYASLNNEVESLKNKAAYPSNFSLNYVSSTGILELIYNSSVIAQIDTPLETAFKSVSYDSETKKLTLTSDTNSVVIDIGDLVDTYSGSDGDQIKVSVDGNTISAIIKDGSVTRQQLASEIYNTLLTYDEIIAKYAEVQTAEETRQINENGRVAAEAGRVTAENGRVEAENERVAAENNRQSTFEKKESARQSAFETNESNRQTAFTTNEAARQTTFNTNETAREAKCEEAIGNVAITDLKKSKTYPWRLQISSEGQPQLVVITD